MPRIEQSITILAPVGRVYEIARDVEAFPQFMADLRSLVVLERSEDNRRTVTEWVGYISAVKLPVRWVQEDLWNETTYRDDFHLLRGDMDRMEGYWQFVPETSAEASGHTASEARTRFDSVVDYEINIPMIGPMIKTLIKKLMTENLNATLNAIKNRAEQGTS